MSDVKRYRFVDCYMRECMCHMEESPPGDRALLYVEATNYDALTAELAKDTANLHGVAKLLTQCQGERDACHEQLAKAQRDHEAQMRRLVGWLSADIPALHRGEVPLLAAVPLLDRFLIADTIREKSDE